MPITITAENFKQEVQEKPGLILVDFWAEWCGPCKILGPILERLEPKVKDKMEIGKLNVDENPVLASSFGIMGIPTVILFKGGQIVEQIVGVRGEADYLALVDKYAVQ